MHEARTVYLPMFIGEAGAFLHAIPRRRGWGFDGSVPDVSNALAPCRMISHIEDSAANAALAGIGVAGAEVLCHATYGFAVNCDIRFCRDSCTE